MLRTRTFVFAVLSLVLVLPFVGAVDTPPAGAVLTPSADAPSFRLNPTSCPIFVDDLLSVAPVAGPQIGIATAHLSATGDDVVVAVLDGGWNLDQPHIASQILSGGYDAVDDDSDPTDLGNGVDDDANGTVDDGVGHGTFVAGMILEVAPDAWVLPIRIANDEGLATETAVLAGIAHARSAGVDVLNLSAEAGTKSTSVVEALEDAIDDGIVVVVSAGNGGVANLGLLAEQAFTIAVGAVTSSDWIAPFSNTAGEFEHLTLFAPGVDVIGPHGGPTDTAMAQWSGTSFAAGFASGAAALDLELHPGSTPAQVAARLESAVDPVYDVEGLGVVVGVGRLDLTQLVALP